MNVFTIKQTDGNLNNEPSGQFTDTGALPRDPKTIMKGLSDIVLINDGLSGFKDEYANIYVEENGEPAYFHKGSLVSAWIGNGNPPLKGKTIYGYIITYGSRPTSTSNATLKTGYIINFITDINFKTGVATYKGWGRTGLEFTVGNKAWYGYSITGAVSSTVLNNGRTDFGPITFVLTDNGAPVIPFITVQDGTFIIGELIVSANATLTQHTENQNYINDYGPTAITILDTDVIIPSLEDRVDQLEKQVAALPNDIDAAFALAVDKVSKIFVSR